jgi:hypothetical protein
VSEEEFFQSIGEGPSSTAVMVNREDDGEINLTLGGGVPVSDLLEALRTVPADSVLDDVVVSWFCEADDCDGACHPDDEHCYPVVTLTVAA